jgi:hypothetical protein
MRRRLTTLRAKQGHTQNGADRTLIDIALYREHAAHNTGGSINHSYDSEYGGFSWATRPRDQAISLRARNFNQG